MSANTKIEWTEATWSPVTGCTRVSDGCLNCYIERTPPFRMSHRRFDRDGIGGTTGVLLHPGRLGIPLKWRKPKRIFVCSMADLFHAEVPDEFIARVWHVMRMAPDHTFQVLTKRHDRMRSLLNSVDFRELVFGLGGVGRGQANGHLEHYRQWPVPNVWLGVSTENQQWANIRIPVLLDTPAAVRFISAEPLLGPIDLIGQGGNMVGAGMYALPDPPEYDGGEPVCQDHGVAQCQQGCTFLDWVIVGGESGPGARPMHPAWARDIQRQCAAADVPFLFKQWGDWTPLAPLVDGKFDFTRGITMTDDGITYNRGDLDYPDGPRRGEAMRADFPHHHPTSMYRVGKGRAGRELYHDGRTWDEYPGG
ncbi:DUF5131 family protein [Mycolicibacterium fortuitum]|uniref:DUF5131 family protein n=1 Tax=Mycolicibacterium fortuitum TaxID=1766 RepID=UPI0007EA2CD7|nr:phage Gp37/Gp68 family protein [Mycolicibacterium fortuitum]OBF77034.1 hypothetical protein A5751_22910 [Mycolicibacterium fortuitum]